MVPASSTSVIVKLVMNQVSVPCAAPRLVPVKVPEQSKVVVSQVSLIEKPPTTRNGAIPVSVNVTSMLKVAEKLLPSDAAVAPVTEAEPLIVSPETSEHALNVIVADVPLTSSVTEPLTAHGS